MSHREIALAAVLMAGLLLAGPSPAAAEETAGGCVIIESLQADGGTCRARLRNSCAGALSVTVEFEIDLWRFVRHAIPPRPPGEGHEGEPAAGHYVGAGVQTGQQAGILAAGASASFEHRGDGEGSLIVGCRARVRATPAP